MNAKQKLAAAASAYEANGTWDQARAYYGLDDSFMWDNERVVNYCKDYRDALAKEAADAKELAAYRAVAKRFAKT